MIEIANTLVKTEFSDLFLYTSDASQLVNFSSGCISIKMSLDGDVKNGVFELCDKNKKLSDFLIFSVNQSDKFFSFPGMYASFSIYGIIFFIWTKSGLKYICDNTTTFSSGEFINIDFCWDNSATKLGYGSTMAIFVNGKCTSSSNAYFDSESTVGLNFLLLDSKKVDFLTLCKLHEVSCYSSVPSEKKLSVDFIGFHNQTADGLFLLGKNYSVEISRGNKYTRGDIYISSFSKYSCDVDDCNLNLYFCKFYGEKYLTGSVYRVDELGVVKNSLNGLKNPKSVSVVQKDGVSGPKFAYFDDSSCLSVWILTDDYLIKADPNLNLVFKVRGFKNPYCAVASDDGSCLVSDTGYNCIKRFSGLGVLENIVSIQNPTLLCSFPDGRYVALSDAENKIFSFYKNDIVSSIDVSSPVSCISSSLKDGGLFVGYKNGKIEKYDKSMNITRYTTVGKSLDYLISKRGYNQSKLICFDSLSRKMTILSSADFSIFDSFYVDEDFLFSGCIASFAKNESVNIGLSGQFDIGFGSSPVSISVKTELYKTLSYDIDLSGGKAVGSFDFSIGNVPSSNPTDYPGKLVIGAKL